MKTPKNNKTVDENDKSKSESAKKLVQARLPFKIIATTIADDTVGTKEQSSPSAVQLKKRKLSDKDYDDSQQAEVQQQQQQQTKNEDNSNKKMKLLAEEIVTVVLSDEEHDDVSAEKKTQSVMIKLPFGNKKGRRRKSVDKSADVSSDDVDALNPQKKVKVATETIDLESEAEKENDEKVTNNNEVETKKTDEEESSDCDTCSSSSSEEKDTTINLLASDATKTEDVNESATENKVKKPLSKKQQELMQRRRQAREEKERKLQEEKVQKQKEKEEKDEQRRKEREEKEEQKRKEREDKEEKKRQEREEKERKRLAEIEAKNEEKRKRNEAKEQERKRKDLEKEEAELRKQKRAEAFTKFFVPKTETHEKEAEEKEQIVQLSASQESAQNLAFRPFQVKGAMKLAPICRRQLTQNERKSFDEMLVAAENSKEYLYLKELKMGKHLPIKCLKTVSNDVKETSSDMGDDDDVCILDELENDAQAILVESNARVERMRAKYYKFAENRRPPYYGTWRKQSRVIHARKPFAQDTQNFDYEVDSDLEWEEEEPGESLEDSEADEKDKESEENDDYDVDNEWMVPHGHLSEEEMENEEEGVALGDENTRDAQKAKLQILQQEFALEMKKKTKKIQPRLVGCIWVDLQGKQPSTCSNIIWHSLNLRAMLCSKSIVLEPQPEPEPEEKPQDVKKLIKPVVINDSMSNELVRLVHGNSHAKNFLVKEFLAHIEANEPAIKNGECLRPLKSTVRRKIEKYAVWKIVEDSSKNTENTKKLKKRLCWVVNPEILARKGLEHLSLNNEWKYTLTPTTNKLKQKQEVEVETKAETETETITPIEVEKIVTPTVETKITTPTSKKRVPILMSVARGKPIPTNVKNTLISNFLKKPGTDSEEMSQEVITLD